MALEHAILVSLSERAASGYDLARRFDASIGFFWPASHQQIYRVLSRMQDSGWISSTVQTQDGRPDKKTYAITSTGDAELDRWAAEPSNREALRSDFAVKLRGFRDSESILIDTRNRKADHEQRLKEYEESQAKFYPVPTKLTGTDLGAWLALRGGIHSELQGIAWCGEILKHLEGRESR